ncbi:MAG: DMT family transporter [Bryobacteraceae bacterium]
MKPSGSWLLLSAAAVLFSTGGAAIKATSLTSWQVASFRSGIAAAVLLLLLPQARRLGSRAVWVAAPAYAATVILFVAANKLTTAANSIFLQSTAPLYLLLAGPWLLKEPVRRSDLAFLAAAAVGLSLFFLGTERAEATAPDPARGNVVALLSGLTWALTIAGLRWHARGGSQDASLAMVAAGNLIAFGVTLPLALPISPGGRDVTLLVFLGVFQIGLAYVCLSRGIRHATALETSLLLLLEPVLNPIWAWLVHHEKPSGWALAGGALILAATTVRGLLRR